VQKCILFLGSPAYALSVVLLSLLGFGAIGARSTARVPAAALGPAVRRALGAAAAAAVVAVLALSPTFDALAHWHRPLRVVVAIAVLAPVGFLLGRPLPLAVRALARRRPAVVPWAWGVNGAASVLGSVLALVLALAFGLNQALLAGGILYALTTTTLGGPIPGPGRA
jgi:hypothetical protein